MMLDDVEKAHGAEQALVVDQLRCSTLHMAQQGREEEAIPQENNIHEP